MRIDIYADLVCPWCFIGKRRMERAVAQWRANVATDEMRIRWHPFQLNPQMPAEGMDRAAYLNWKFGGGERVVAIQDRLMRDGAAEGIAFAFARIRRMPNTRAAHRLIALAQAHGDAEELIERLFVAYFVEGRDIGDARELTALAVAQGLAETAVRELLRGDGEHEAIAAADLRARSHGINAVPCYVIDGRYALSGAQPPEVFLRLFDLARQPADTAVGRSA